ncbi:SagB/ThcOx family dehydrogenase [Pseudomonas fulva]|uniref:SagB/ThcOx family dehydrogenase n=1 Tax=Pseudomonas TaxID=286 RepID=UPI0019CF6B6D|nr:MULTISPECIES: SagB/ThcOx family dehydrogenase [Pseudomonas]MCY4125999.1 SagB/ThcOx family dehydrogenase [Pseudomonas sp.]MBN6788841.1 SagB/ThcOx family dehydrogenase [Pseudomonas fulva]MBN6793465.1 SagB/ThcOx family dehydrogenase [Pseudomonas fulva]MBN6854471.1 SagB/ThcOx family dehydrogenase [Pseudomonas fulva]MBN6871788.1 SagB/ThcOx family dehydrogenase [Pseudomonas fulva]
MKISPYFFIFPHDSNLVLWNFKNHKQYIVNQAFLRRIHALTLDISRYDPTHALDTKLHELGVIIESFEKPDPWGWDMLSWIFHIGTKDIPCTDIPKDSSAWAKAYIAHCNDALSRPLPSPNQQKQAQHCIKLNPPVGGELDLYRKRQTCRAFNDSPVKIDIVSMALFYCLGFLKERDCLAESMIPEPFRKRRCCPSGGGLNATEGYLYAQNVEGLESGLYYYDPEHHRLDLRSKGTYELGPLLGGQHFADELAFGLFLTSRLDKLWWKYTHSRAYRMALIEIGHVSQMFLNVCTQAELGTWLTGALTDSKIEELLGIDRTTEEVLFFVGAGHGTGRIQPVVLEEFLANGQTTASDNNET